MKFEEIKATNYKVGDRIQCWSDHECTHTMMVLAAKGIITDEDPRKKNCLIVKRISE